MKLIDADAFLQNLVHYKIGRQSLEEVIKAVKNQPTAFDVNKVIRQLEDEEEQSYANFEKYADDIGITEDDDWHFIGLKRAIEIVKEGEIKC